MHFVIQNKGHVSSGVTKVILGLQVLGQSGGGGGFREEICILLELDMKCVPFACFDSMLLF